LNRGRIDLLAIALFMLGVVTYVAFRRAYPHHFDLGWILQVATIPLALALAFIRPLGAEVGRLLDRLTQPTRGAALITAGCVAAATFAYQWISAVVHSRDLTPHSHDACSYLIQAQMLARGRLWMPTPPLADFFETFHVLMHPVYASIYFPGTALLYVPGVWLGAPAYLTSLLIAAAVAGVLYLVTRELLDGMYGILAALILAGSQIFRTQSTGILSQQPLMLAALLMVWTYLRWRGARSTPSRTAWALALGAALGWAAIVRPIDALAYALPVGALFLLDLWRLYRDSARAAVSTLALVMLPILPFLALQIVLNKGATGDWLTTPYRAYIDRYQPNTSLGFPGDDPSDRPDTVLSQKHVYYELWVRPKVQRHRPELILKNFLGERLAMSWVGSVHTVALLILLPLGIRGGLRDRWRSFVLVAPILFLVLYTFNPYFLWHYPMVIAPAIILLILFGLDELIRAVATLGAETRGRAFLALLAVGVCLSAMPEVNLYFGPDDERETASGSIEAIFRQHDVVAPAVVLFHYRVGDTAGADVYNYDVVWPLDAPIIRAHDLAERNRELIEYFVRHDPGRRFYYFERNPNRMTKIGDVNAARAWLQARHPDAR
jgi:4-amino-4-deoxy-L-arabinose transferase-like glycosyltransferase